MHRQIGADAEQHADQHVAADQPRDGACSQYGEHEHDFATPGPAHGLRGHAHGQMLDAFAGETIAAAAHRLDEVIETVGRQRLAQPPDVHVDRTLLDEHVLPPDPVEHLLARIDPLGMTHEEPQQPILGRPELDRAVAGSDALAGRVQGQPLQLQRLVAAAGQAASQHRAHVYDRSRTA